MYSAVDVVVVGAGPSGCAAAITLARMGRSVIVLDGSDRRQPRQGEHMPPAIRPLLHRLGVNEDDLRHSRSGGISVVWGHGAPRHTDYIFEPYSYGYSIDRQHFTRNLVDIARTSGAAVRMGARARTLQRLSDDHWAVGVSSREGANEWLVSRFLVDATGRAGRIGRKLGATRYVVDGLVGVAAQFSGTGFVQALDGRLIVESSEHGWWYATALSPERASVVMLTDADVLRKGSARIGKFWGVERGSKGTL
jgi:flavin-dependent dehydrogenase